MASKAPKFGAWEGGENYTVYFENARKTKNNGQMINTNDPQENSDMFQQNGTPSRTPPTQSRAESQEQQSKVPQFGAWDNGDSVGYTVYFENAQKTKSSGPAKAGNQAQGQPKPGARSKMPQFGNWNEGESVAYTAYFDNARKNKNDGVGAIQIEPQLNRDVAPAVTKAKSGEQLVQGGVGSGSVHRGANEDGPERNTSQGSTASMARSETLLRQGRQRPGGQTPQHPRAGKPQLKPVSGGSQNSEKGEAIPQFGVRNTHPSQAEGFTGAFMRAREDRMTPLNKNTRAFQQQQAHQSDEAKKKCCFPWF